MVAVVVEIVVKVCCVETTGDKTSTWVFIPFIFGKITVHHMHFNDFLGGKKSFGLVNTSHRAIFTEQQSCLQYKLN